MATVRRQIIIDRSADDVYAVLGNPLTIAEWFPGVASATVDGTARVITTESGLPMAEEIVTNDAIQRRFQYRLAPGFIQDHIASIDVFDIGGGHSLVSYATDCEPAALALMIGGATGNALKELKRQLERDVTKAEIES
jgi:carbon monoxide dehydrogenase subunit G